MNSPRLIGVGLNEEPHNTIIADYRRLKARSDPAVTKELAALYPRRPTDLVVENVDANGIGAEWVAAPEADTAHAIFYLHGGGYTEGSPRSHRELVARLARVCGVRALVPELSSGAGPPLSRRLGGCSGGLSLACPADA